MLADKLNWLVLDDDETDLDNFQMRLESEGQEVFRASNTEIAKEILRKNQIHVCVFDFYLGSENHTSEQLITEMRRYYPSIPIVLCTNSRMEGKLVERFLAAGTDAILPKAWKEPLFKVMLKTAGLTAYRRFVAQNRLNLELTTSSSRLFIPVFIQNKLDIFAQRVSGVTLISGDKNTGKTLIARRLAESIKDEAASKVFLQIREINCAESPSEILNGDIFETGKTSFAQINAFEATHGGIVILDNIDTMPKEMLIKLRNIFKGGFYTTPKGRKISVADTKFIFTYHAHSESVFPRDFLSVLKADKIALPAIHELEDDFGNAVRFFVNREAKRRAWSKITIHTDYLTELSGAVSRAVVTGNFQGLSLVIEDSVRMVIASGRTTLYPGDLSLPRLGHLTLGPLPTESDEATKLLNALIALIRKGGSLSQVQDVAIKATIAQLIKQHGSNVNSILKKAGISKSHLYRLDYLELLEKLEQSTSIT